MNKLARKDFMGPSDIENSHSMLDFFYENGGNFIDTWVPTALRYR
jgi:aryl-alcohol dehydrogenase-like predicted oxidoreductase